MSAIESNSIESLMFESVSNKARILLIDADPLVRKLAVKTLSQHGYLIDVLAEDADVLVQLQHYTYGAVIVDASSGEQSCAFVCKQIRAHYPNWKLPVIIVSDGKIIDEINDCLDAGASDFVVKPVKWPLMLTRLSMALKLSAFSDDLCKRERNLRRAQAMARIGSWYMKDDPGNVTFSDEFCTILDISPGSIKTFQHLFEIVHPDDQEMFMSEIQQAFIDHQSFSFSHQIKMENGQVFYVRQIGEFYSEDGSDNASLEFFVTMRDETENFFTKESLHREKYYDRTTGLANKHFFKEAAERAKRNADKNESLLTCYFIGIDGFQSVNDALGHAVGDEVLKIMGDRLSSLSLDLGLVSRFSTDIFAAMSDKMLTVDDCELAAEKMLLAISKSFYVGGHELNLKASIGIAFYPIHCDDENELIAAADTAMHSVKRSGGNGYDIYTSQMSRRYLKQLVLESELRFAIENEELELFYQPQISICGTRVTGMEALIRWRHPHKGLIPPFEFIEIAEENGLIIPMGEWVINRACQDAVEWHRMGFPDLRVGINLSAKQFNDKDFFAKIERAVMRTGIQPSTLELEVTESSAMSDLETSIQILQSLREMGANTSMDDFGTGYSSLSNLQRLPLNTLKIDRAFVKDIDGHNNAGAIASAIIAMAKGLGMETIAEGVETEPQLDFMRKHACDVIQGFYYSKPLPKTEFTEFLLGFSR